MEINNREMIISRDAMAVSGVAIKTDRQSITISPGEMVISRKAILTGSNEKILHIKLSPYRQKEIMRYLNSMKTEESVKRNIAKIILHLTGGHAFAGRTL
ncbi:MAG: YdeI/OmpD-associated family protein [Bacteroidia bacterium]